MRRIWGSVWAKPRFCMPTYVLRTDDWTDNEYIAVCLPVKDSAMVVSLYPYIRIRITLLIVMPESTATAGRVSFFCSLVKDAWIESQSWRWWPASSNPAGEVRIGAGDDRFDVP